jgi:hypothetical protein
MIIPIRSTDEIEQDRLRLADELAAESGTGWADGYRPGTAGCHELLDRTSMLADMLEAHLLSHPACVANPDWYRLAEQATAALRELYQQVGAEHLAAEEPSERRSSDGAA